MTTKRTPWNKGLRTSEETKKKISSSKKGKTSWNKGIPCTKEHKEKISKANKGRTAWNKNIPREWDSPTEFKKGDNSGIYNHQWKGDDVSYRNIHRWVERQKGKANECCNCGIKKGRIHWANIDHCYRRDTDDYISLCAKCHGKHDRLLRSQNGVNSGEAQNG